MRCFLACDVVARDPTGFGPGPGKPTIYNLFDVIYAENFPAIFKPFNLFVRMVGGVGKYKVSLKVIGVDRKLLSVKSQAKEVELDGRLLEMILAIDPLPLTGEGSLKFVIQIDGKDAGWPCELSVKQGKLKK